MSFDCDPQEQDNVSAADFAMMCDEMEKLKEQRDELLAIMEKINNAPCNSASVAALSREGIDIVKGGAA